MSAETFAAQLLRSLARDSYPFVPSPLRPNPLLKMLAVTTESLIHLTEWPARLLGRLLSRIHEAMAEDRGRWIEPYVNDDWSAEEMLLAARFYRDYLGHRMSAALRRRSRINAQAQAIETRLAALQVIEKGGAPPAVMAALLRSRTTKEPRYARNLDDLHRVANILYHDAQRDLVRLVGHAYDVGLFRMPVFTPGAADSARPLQKQGLGYSESGGASDRMQQGSSSPKEPRD